MKLYKPEPKIGKIFDTEVRRCPECNGRIMFRPCPCIQTVREILLRGQFKDVYKTPEERTAKLAELERFQEEMESWFDPNRFEREDVV